jgi:hypothetical protein
MPWHAPSMEATITESVIDHDLALRVQAVDGDVLILPSSTAKDGAGIYSQGSLPFAKEGSGTRRVRRSWLVSGVPRREAL